MKLHATITGAQAEIEIRERDAHVWAVVDGRRYELDVSQSQPGNYLFVHDGRVFSCRVDGTPQSGSMLNVTVGTTTHGVTLIDPKRLRSAAVFGADSDGAAHIVAPMPGKVVRILVETGQQVEAGSGIAVVEAMKMQNEMKSPKSGTVVKINVEVGVTVNGGDLLAVIE
jgi:biotin carboxyl carrier protein